MLTDEQLIDRIGTELRAGLAALEPPEDLLERLGEPPGRSRGQSHRLAPRRWGRRARLDSVAALRALPVVLAVLVVVAVAVVAVSDLRHPARRSTTSAEVSGRQRLIDILAVLRRPQTKVDLRFPSFILRQRGGPSIGTPDRPLIRYATRTPWGARIYFVPMKPPTAAALAAFERRNPGLPRQLFANLAKRGESLGVYSNGGGGAGGTAADIEAGDSLELEGAGRAFDGGSTQTRLILVVPDGVAKVTFLFGRQSAGVYYGAPIYPHSLSVPVAVHDNVAAVQVERQCCSAQIPMIWYAADGHVIKRLGNLSAVNRVVARPIPGPETALSRAAERNPSTPNRVWVTPRTGEPQTQFMIHFRELLNGADYRYTFSGAKCPQVTLSRGSFSGVPGAAPNDLRGDLWTDPLAAAGHWCPGTYRVSVTAIISSRYGPPKRAARPFGTATFTVRP